MIYDSPIGDIVQIQNRSEPVMTGIICDTVLRPFSENAFLVYTDKKYRVNTCITPFATDIPDQVEQNLSRERFLIVPQSDILTRIFVHRELTSLYIGQNVTGKYAYIPQPAAGFGFVTGVSWHHEPEFIPFMAGELHSHIVSAFSFTQPQCCVHLFFSQNLESVDFPLEDLIILDFPCYEPGTKKPTIPIMGIRRAFKKQKRN